MSEGCSPLFYSLLFTNCVGGLKVHSLKKCRSVITILLSPPLPKPVAPKGICFLDLYSKAEHKSKNLNL